MVKQHRTYALPLKNGMDRKLTEAGFNAPVVILQKQRNYADERVPMR